MDLGEEGIPGLGGQLERREDRLVKELVKGSGVCVQRGWAPTRCLLGVGWPLAVSSTRCPAFQGHCVLWAEATAIIHQSLAA